MVEHNATSSPDRAWLDRGRLTALGIGLAAATMLLEFGFGHWVTGHPWFPLLADYQTLGDLEEVRKQECLAG